MTKQKSTKRALLLSALSLLMCVSMLIGSTFAWFTDSVTSGNNKIVAGNLDIELEYYNGSAWNTVNNATDLFTGSLWEPGHTEVVYLKLSNLGTLALKYQLGINIVSETEGTNVDGNPFKLSDYIYMGVVENQQPSFANREAAEAAVADKSGIISTGYTKTGNMTADADDLYLAVVVYMPETVGNEANYKTDTTAPEINLGINLLAAQYTHENDSFNNQYDADAEYENVVDSGTCGGIDWTLGEHGTLTVSPSANPAVDANCGKVFNPGQWREAVIYNSKGEGILEGFNAPNASANEGGYFCDRYAVKALVIEEGVTSIGSFAAQFPNLTGEVVIPSTVTYIGQDCFNGAPITKLTFAKVPDGQVGEELCIAHGAFKNLDIEEVALPDDRPVHLHCWTFLNCKQLKHLTLPATVTEMKGSNHVDYLGNPNAQVNAAWVNYSQIVGGKVNTGAISNPALETVTFGSAAVEELFFKYSDNKVGTDTRYGVANVVKGTEIVYCTSLQVAADIAESGDTITLTSNTNEVVEIPAGVALVKNGFTAENVIVK